MSGREAEPNSKEEEEEEEWQNFNKTHPSIFKIKVDSFRNDLTRVEKWLTKHQFWYETLPNEGFSECFARLRPNETLPAEIGGYMKQNSARYQVLADYNRGSSQSTTTERSFFAALFISFSMANLFYL